MSRNFYENALVTGASSGIGRELARQLAARGTHVVVSARRAEALAELVDEISRAGGKAKAVPLDVADTERTVRVIREEDAARPLDLVIANAGVGAPPRGQGTSYSWEAIAGSCHVNFCGAAATLTAVLPAMVERGRGHIVGISSLAALTPLPEAAGYCAPKAGLSMLLECLRLDLLATGVAATSVHAGFVKTPMTERAKHPMPLIMECADAVALILRKLEARPANIDFPGPLALAARTAGRMPRSLRDLAMRYAGQAPK
jgi:short-subunit dehydrogenase